MRDDFKQFIERLEESLERRYYECLNQSVAPSSILLSVLDAVAEAKEGFEPDEKRSR